MRRGTRGKIALDPAKRLYRRFRPEALCGGELSLDAIDMPDMSVMCEQLTEDIAWVLIDPSGEHDFGSWGVAAFRGTDIPPSQRHLGTELFDFFAEHEPVRNNYPHSVVAARRNGKRLAPADVLPPQVHLRFRYRLRCKTVVVVAPKR